MSMACVRRANTHSNLGFLSRLISACHRSSDERILTGPWIRTVIGLAAETVQSPIGESHVPGGRGEKNKTQKRSGINSVVGIGFNTNPSVGEIAHKYQWGIQIPDSNRNFQYDQKSAIYDTAHKSGINSIEYANSEDPTNHVKHSATIEHKSNNINPRKTLISRPIGELCRTEIEKLPPSESTVNSSHALSRESSVGLGRIPVMTNEIAIENSILPVILTATTDSDAVTHANDDYNVHSETPQNGEVLAWQELAMRSTLPEVISQNAATNVDSSNNPIPSIFIRPEPPKSKLNVQAIGPLGQAHNFERNDINSLGLTPKTMDINLIVKERFHTYTRGLASHPFQSCGRTNLYSSLTNDEDGKEYQPISTEFENITETETNETRKVQTPYEGSERPKVEEDLSSVLQELSQREMEVLLSYTRESSEDGGSGSRLPTAVTIATFSPDVSDDTSKSVEAHKTNHPNTRSVLDAEMPGLDRAILKLEEEESSEEEKNRKYKGGYKGENYIRIPGDPYPYSREHYEKWRVPHGKCPVVNDDIPKAKSVETSDGPWSTLIKGNKLQVKTCKLLPSNSRYPGSSRFQYEDYG